MRLSRYFLPTLKEDPVDATIVSHRLMMRAGLVRQSAAGIYTWLPMGLRVLRHIETIIREEQNRAGAVELLMPTLQAADLWRESGRYDDYGKEMLRIADRHGRDLVYGPTNEELITQIFRDNVQSYKQLPCNLYHIQWKFRDEIRPRFGVLRGREFLMKDAYSFDLDTESARVAYRKMFVSYLRIFARLGLDAVPVAAEAGPIGGDMSHEFVILAPNGESEIFCHADLLNRGAPDADYEADLTPVVESFTALYARSDDKHDPKIFDAEVPSDKQVTARGIEVGHIFHFGDKYTEAMNCRLAAPDGQEVALQCGSYGIGVSRLVGGIIEACHDDDGIVWPWPVAPFKVGIVNLQSGQAECDALCEQLYDALMAQGIEPLYDDRDERAGRKFSDMDLIGLQWQAVVGPRGAKDGTIELKARATGDRHECDLAAAVERVSAPPDEK